LLAPAVDLDDRALHQVNAGRVLGNTYLDASHRDLTIPSFPTRRSSALNHAMNWTAGNMAGGGRTIISPGATLNVSNANNINLSSSVEHTAELLSAGPLHCRLLSANINYRTVAILDQQSAGSPTNGDTP